MIVSYTFNTEIDIVSMNNKSIVHVIRNYVNLYT